MPTRTRFLLLLSAALSTALLISPRANAQCEGTLSTQFHNPGIESPGIAYALTTFDSGSGPDLYVGGIFGTVGGVTAGRIARWNGTSWSDVAGGVDGEVRALIAFDDGNGAKLYASGKFAAAGGNPALRIAVFDGTTWAPLGAGVGTNASDTVFALCVFDDGSGPELYAGGIFNSAGGIGATNVARWSFAQHAWIPLPGIAGSGINALAVFDDGNGAQLYAGGNGSLKRWNGATWSSFAPASGNVFALKVFDDGAGPDLYVGGKLTLANGGTGPLESWNGTSWTTLIATNQYPTVYAIEAHDDGGGPTLYVAGNFITTPLGSDGRVKRWNGATFTDLPALTWGGTGSANNIPFALESHDEGSGPALFAGGAFQIAGGVQANGIARWKTGAWSSLGGGAALTAGCDALFVADLGWGPKLFASGDFFSAGDAAGTKGIAMWGASGWSSVGGGFTTGFANCGTVYDDGSGPSLVVGGPFTGAGGQPLNRIARWNGVSWSNFGPGLDSGPFDMVAFDDGSGPALFVCGFFSLPGQGDTYVAKWNGSSWLAIGSWPVGSAFDLIVFDDGSGPALYAAGGFLVSGNQFTPLRKWNGSSWTDIGTMTGDFEAYSAAVADLGSGPRLYVAGQLNVVDGVAMNRIASWDGTTWSPLGAGVNGGIEKIVVHDEGSGPVLYVCGDFTQAGGLPSPKLARWNGSQWSAPPFAPGSAGPMASPISCMCSYDDGSGGGADLYIGGFFKTFGGIISEYIAELVRCPDSISPFCYGDGAAKECPCGNESPVLGRGCDNSASTGGARLTGSGTTSPDTIVLTSDGELASVLTIFLQGSASVWPGVYFGDGLRCVGGSLKRLYTHNASSGVVSAPVGGDLSITARSAALGDTIQPGDVRYYQAWYRDPIAVFCDLPDGNNWNVSSGVAIRW